MIEYITIQSSTRTELIDITSKVQKAIRQNNTKNGVCYVYVPHTTAAVTINEGADPAVRHDILSTLNRLVPEDLHYTHMEGNADAHVKASLIGPSAVVLLEEGSLKLGTWQAIFFCEFDGPRQRRVTLKIIEG